MNAEIRQYIECCTVCAAHSYKQPMESIAMHETCNRPWEKMGTDIFTINNREYLITVDYCSNFFEVDYLPDTLSETVITKLKYHFARHGIPDILISDGGPQYTSTSFKNFSSQWGFQHELSSPGNSQANGAAEAAVKIAKSIMKKCATAHEDPYMGLLNMRNTPTEGLGISPVQRLFGRRTKTAIPTTFNNLRPMFDDQWIKEKQDDKRAAVAEKANQHRHDLKPLQEGDSVRLQPVKPFDKVWKSAVVTKKLENRTYEVTTSDGKVLRRNRRLIRASKANGNCDSNEIAWPISITTNNDEAGQADEQRLESNPTIPEMPSPDIPNQYYTRSGRLSKPPDRLNI